MEIRLTGEPFATIGPESRRRERRRGKCHSCGEVGHWARDCAPMEEPATEPAAEEPSGAAEKPESSPMDSTHATNFEGEGCSLAGEGATDT